VSGNSDARATDEVVQILAGLLKAEDVILTMGAGNVGQLAMELPQKLTAVLKP
jgi:UDP-N-acetylmuramate--alanine ligase